MKHLQSTCILSAKTVFAHAAFVSLGRIPLIQLISAGFQLSNMSSVFITSIYYSCASLVVQLSERSHPHVRRLTLPLPFSVVALPGTLTVAPC